MRIRLSGLLVLIAVGACGEKSAPAKADTVAKAPTPSATALRPGEAMLPVDGGSIWYKKSGAGTGTPVILVHGGPGFSSYYLKSLEALGDDRPVVRYDQLGGGKATGLTDTTKMNIPHFVAELDSLRSALGYDKFHLVGHSWGTMLGYEYYKAHPEHVSSIVFGSACLDIPAYEKRAKSLVATLSDSAQRAIKLADSTKKYDEPAFQNAMNEFYGKYVWRHPVEADLDSTMKSANEGIYNYMQGPSEFTITGTLKPYNVTGELGKIKVPTLYTVGEFDEVGPEIVKGFANKTPGAKYALIPGSAHLTTWDNPTEMIKVVREFLASADARK